MDVMQACRCCLRCPPDKDLTTPYTHLGATEIYADMLKQCFDIQLLVDDHHPCGICSACVGRLRDARYFKLQVQRSQAELQARLQAPAPLTKEEPKDESETPEEDWISKEPELNEEPAVETEMLDGDGASEEPELCEESSIKPKLLDEDETPEERSCYQNKVMHLLATLAEQNNQIVTWIRSQNETDEIKRKKEPVKLPVKLPMCDENKLSTLEEYLNNDINFGEMCSYLMSFCGNSPTSSVNQILRYTISDELASKFSYRGKKGKRPFENLNLKLVLIRTVKNHFKLPVETTIEDDIKVWLKHAPQRYKIRSMKKQKF